MVSKLTVVEKLKKGTQPKQEARADKETKEEKEVPVLVVTLLNNSLL